MLCVYKHDELTSGAFSAKSVKRVVRERKRTMMNESNPFLSSFSLPHLIMQKTYVVSRPRLNLNNMYYVLVGVGKPTPNEPLSSTE